MENTMQFGQHILQYQEDILRDIEQLVRIPSVAAVGGGEYPLGEQAAKALQWILNRAQEMGLETVNTDNMAGHASYGEGDEVAAVLTHVDVVPAGDGWKTDPFTVLRQDGKLYGRGVADDKGPAVVALYCLKALKDAGVVGKRKIRAIFGAGEEINSDDIAHYLKTQPLPVMGFTPDADYGVCNREKGILRLKVSAPSHNGTTLTAMYGGTVVNAVPDKAVALLDCTEQEDHQLQRLADGREGNFDFQYTIDGLKIVSYGKASHAMHPQEGFNAATHLISLLAAGLGEAGLGSLCAFLDDAVGLECNGNSLGIAQSDEPSGALTLNVGVVQVGSEGASAGIDIRYPVTADGDAILEKIRARAQKEGLTVEVESHSKPLFVPDDSQLVQLLNQAYQSVTGQPAEVYATGGGTYARQLAGRGVAFGPFFKGENPQYHNVGENIDIERFMQHAQICLEAMYRMFTA